VGFRIYVFGFRVSGCGLRILGFGFRVAGCEVLFLVFGLRVAGFGTWFSGFECSGVGLRVSETRIRSDAGMLSLQVLEGPRLKLRNIRACEPQIRARLGTAVYFCEVVCVPSSLNSGCPRVLPGGYTLCSRL
jgi:hypothetical protein